MKFLSSCSLIDGPVNGQIEFIFETDINESNELRKALSVVQSYEKAVIKEYIKKYGYNPAKVSDWYMLDYCIKNDKIIVQVSDGACG